MMVTSIIVFLVIAFVYSVVYLYQEHWYKRTRSYNPRTNKWEKDT